MFSKLFELSHRRNFSQAVGFYISYSLITAIITVILASISLYIFKLDTSKQLILIGNYTSFLFTLFISILILYKKKLTKNFYLILIAVFSSILSYYGGVLIGFLPVTFITTK